MGKNGDFFVNVYPIYIKYGMDGMDKTPIGSVNIVRDLSTDLIYEGAIVPLLRKDNDNSEFVVISFDLIPRTAVDIRPRTL